MTVDRQHAPPTHSEALGDGLGEDYVKSAHQVDREATWKAIKEFADTGKGSASSLPELFHRAESPDGAKDVMGAIAKRTTREIVFACVRESRMAVDEALKFVLVEAKPAANPAQLKADLELYLRGLTTWDLTYLDAQPAVIDEVKKIFKNVPLGDLCPELASIPELIHDKKLLLGWMVSTTNPTVLGRRLAALPRVDTICPTLDAIGGWGWLDSFHLTPSESFGYTILDMQKASGNQAAKDKLAKLGATFTEDMDKRQAERKPARAAMDDQLGKRDDGALLDAAARTQRSHQGDAGDVKSRLANATPDMVFELIVATDQDFKLGIQLLDGAKDVADDKKTKLSAAEYIRELVHLRPTSDVVAGLSDDTTRKLIRKHLGRDTSLLGLFTISDRLEIHTNVVKSAALRQWLYEDSHPETLLWVAAGGPDAREGSRMVRSERGNAWVKKLPPGADETQLRRFVLASNDPGSVKYVRDTLLNDQEMRVAAPQTKPLDVDPAAYGAGARKDFDAATDPAVADSSTVVARLADLTDSERAAVLKDPLALKRLFDDVFGDDLVRAVNLLNPTIAQLLTFPLATGRTFDKLFTYIAMRPDVEAVTAVKRKPSIDVLRQWLGKTSPFDVFAVLRTNPKALASVLLDNSALFEWILDDTEPNTALRILAQPPVRAIAARHLQGRKTMLHDLPDFEKLTGEGKRDYKIVAERLTDKKAKERSTDYVADEHSGDHDANVRALDLRHAREKHTLVEGIRKLSADQHIDKSTLLALVRAAQPPEQAALLAGAHPDEVKTVRTFVDMGPQYVFPELGLERLFALPGARDWLLDGEAPTTILAMLAVTPAAVKPVGEFLDGAPDWLDRCPRGGELTVKERNVIDDIAKHFHTLASYEKAFHTRFDVEVTGLDYGYTQKLWDLCKRLPPGQFHQNAVRKVAAANIGRVGQWSKPDIELSSDLSRFEDKKDTGFDEGQLLTLDEVKRLYQLSDKDVEQATWIEKDQGKYRVKPIEIEQFKSTVHEIGHSIDTMLGDRTELVYGLANWQTFGIDQFEEWANQMDGFKHITATDKPKVAEAWKQALRANKPVAEMVDADHPARKGSSTSPLIDAATKQKTFRYTEYDKEVYSDRVCFRNGAQLFALNKDAYLSAPSRYSLHGPGEYFAESYVEYYRDYDGTPATESKKGGHLASWIKEWITQHVDRIRLNPQRGKPKKPTP